ncbi:MAG: DUF2189 domain-containing protein [Betaproteobacteria bacterium]|nr:DUF2189 domain-containing protein [Betaproteobacteria bacterium]
MTAPELAPSPFNLPEVRRVPVSRPFRWLRKGWADFDAGSAFYGVCFALMGGAIQFVFREAPHYASSLAMGFLLVGPFLAIGLYDLSRQKEMRGAARLLSSLTAWRANPGAIGVYVLILTVIFLVWARASLVTFALFHHQGLPDLATLVAQLVRGENFVLILAWLGVGAVFAALVFALSVVSIPFLLDARAEAVTAAAASVLALARNPLAMFIWAALIATLTVAALAAFHVGLIIVAPVIGHATWHAYRDVIGPRTEAAGGA